MKRLSALLMLLAAFSLLTATIAQAVPAQKVTGSIVMSTPNQAASFEAFETPVKGSVTYSNFDLAVDGTGVWVPSGTFDASFEYQGLCNGGCVHTLTITGFEPLSPNSVAFEGTGFYVPTPSWTETFTGTIVGNQIEFTLIPDDEGALYGWAFTNVVGTIAPDGSVVGTWSDDLGRFGDVTIDDIGYEAFSYTAPVTCADVTSSTDAVFGFTIPIAPLAGTPVAVTVHDGGSPGPGHDTWAHTVGTCGAGGTDYPIVAGNLVVHS